jgi:predicted DNA-binding transcriptional regulator AlpA
MRALTYEDLPSKGIRISRPQLWRWIKAGAFPAPFKLGGRNAWLEDEIDRHLIDQAAKRDEAVSNPITAA